jgi:hypothetical protein
VGQENTGELLERNIKRCKESREERVIPVVAGAFTPYFCLDLETLTPNKPYTTRAAPVTRLGNSNASFIHYS